MLEEESSITVDAKACPATTSVSQKGSSAAAHLIASTVFGEPDPALGELAYIKARYGRGLSHMDGDAVVALLDAHGCPLGPDPTTVGALVDLLALLREDGRRQEAAQVAEDVYGLTGRSPWASWRSS